MAPIIIQPIASSTQTLEVDLPGHATVRDLKLVIAERSGIEIDLQRLVVRGRVLLDNECLEDVRPKGEGRMFLAISSAPRAGASVLSERALSPRIHAEHVDRSDAEGGSCSQAAVPASPSCEVVVRTVDCDSEVRVCARLAEPTLTLKCEILRRLPHIAALSEVNRCSFIFDGHLLDSEDSLEDQGVGAGARIVVVPPRSVRKVDQRWSCKAFLNSARRALCYSMCVARALPMVFWKFLCRTWADPWSLVRPDIEDSLHRRRRIHMFQMQPRAYRYSPGSNPNGEDFTMLFTQGLVGGG